MLVHASSAISLAKKAVPVVGVPAEEVKPFGTILVILYVVTFGPSVSLPKVTPVVPSLQIVVDWSATNGSGFTVKVTVKLSPTHPVFSATGRIVYNAVCAPVVTFVQASLETTVSRKSDPVAGAPADEVKFKFVNEMML